MGVHAFEQELGCADGSLRSGFCINLEGREFFKETLDLLQLFEGAGGGLGVVELNCAAEVEPLFDLLGVGVGEVPVENTLYAAADDLADDGVGTPHLAFVFEFDLAADAGQSGVDVANARDDEGLTVNQRSAFGVRDDEFHGADGETLRDAASFVYFFIFAGGEGDLFDDLADVVGDFDLRGGTGGPCLLRRDRDALLDVLRVVGANLATDAVFEWGDNFAAGGVVLGVGGEDDGNVEREAHRVALNLHVTLLHDVEESDLDFSGEVGDFVDGKDATVGAGKQAIVHRQFATEVLIAAGGLDGVDVADEIGYGDIGGGEFFNETVIGGEPSYRGLISHFRYQVAAEFGDRCVGIIADLGASDVGAGGIEESGEGTENSRLGLAAEAEEDEIVPAKDGVNDLWDDGVFVTDDAGK